MANLYCNHSTEADREHERVTPQFCKATWDWSIEQWSARGGRGFGKNKTTRMEPGELIDLSIIGGVVYRAGSAATLTNSRLIRHAVYESLV